MPDARRDALRLQGGEPAVRHRTRSRSAAAPTATQRIALWARNHEGALAMQATRRARLTGRPDRHGSSRTHRPLPGHPRRGARAVRAVSRRVPPRDRRAARLSRGVRRRADQGRLAGGADPAGVRRLGPRPGRGVGDHGGDQPLAAATPAPATARCTTWARCCATAREEQKQRYLPKIASGELRLQSMGVTEPTTGTDTTQIKTTAVRKGDRYVVNGQKVWISRVQHSRPDDPAGAHDAARRGEEEDRGHVDLPRRPARRRSAAA